MVNKINSYEITQLMILNQWSINQYVLLSGQFPIIMRFEHTLNSFSFGDLHLYMQHT